MNLLGLKRIKIEDKELPVCLSLEERGRKRICEEMVRRSLEIKQNYILANNFHKITAVLGPAESCVVSSYGFQCL